MFECVEEGMLKAPWLWKISSAIFLFRYCQSEDKSSRRPRHCLFWLPQSVQIKQDHNLMRFSKVVGWCAYPKPWWSIGNEFTLQKRIMCKAIHRSSSYTRGGGRGQASELYAEPQNAFRSCQFGFFSKCSLSCIIQIHWFTVGADRNDAFSQALCWLILRCEEFSGKVSCIIPPKSLALKNHV